MAPVNQLGVLAFASAVLAVPHAQWQPFKRHAHASAPAAYESSYVPVYGEPSSSEASPASSSAAPSYPAASSSADPVSSAPAVYGSSSSYAAPVSSSAIPYGSSSSSYVLSSSGSPVSSAPVPSGSFPACWATCFQENGNPSEAELCGNEAVSKCICDTCDGDDDKTYKGWLTDYCAAGSSSSAGPVSSAPPYPVPSGSSGYPVPTGGYGTGAWGSSGFPSLSVCTETSTLIYRSTTAYSTYYVTHTIYESAASSAAAESGAPGYGNGAPASSAAAESGAPGGYPAGSAPAHYAAPASSASPADYSGAPAGPAGGESCVPDVTVTTTVQTTVYVTPEGPYGGAPSSEAAPSYGGGAPSSAAPVPSSEAAPSYSAPSYGAPSSGAAPSYSSPSSSEAPAPSYSAPAGGAGGAPGTLGKRGIAYNDASLANSLAGGAAGGWAYNWGSDSAGLDSSIPFIPMLWGPTADFTPSWEANAKAGIAAGAQYLFSFNEPDMSSQANLSPEAAAAAWKQYMEPFAGQAKLVSPAVTNGQGTGIGLDWLNSFLEACSDCTIDAVGLHWYYAGNPVDEFKSQISAVAEATGKGIWLSEFGADGSDEDKSSFLSEALPWLDSNDSILGYSYFMVADGSLMDGTSPSSWGASYCN